MKGHQASEYVDYQERTREFSVGDTVVPEGGSLSEMGRVTEVHPGIGYVDVEFVGGNERFPVEELLRFDGSVPVPPHTNSAPVTKMVQGSLESVLSAVKLAAEMPYLSKLSVLQSLQGCSPRVTALGHRVALDLWAAHDPGTTLLLLERGSGFFGERSASAQPLKRHQQGRKPFLASAWSRQGSEWIRTLESPLLKGLRVATIVPKQGLFRWALGAQGNLAEGSALSLDGAQEHVDLRLAPLGFALK